MKCNKMNFAVTTLSVALFFTLFLFTGRVAAEGCQEKNGCDSSANALYNATAYSNPTYSPSWTEVTKASGRVRGGQYLKFAVVEGEIYQWSTEGKEDAFSGSFAAACNSDNECRTSSDITDRGLRCINAHCLLPFDTELTLLKGESCSSEAEFLAYSNSGGTYGQSQLDWKADFTGTVVLLITNYAFKANEGVFVECQKTSGVSADGWDMTTTVKWHRTSSEHCATCNNTPKYNYRTDKTSVSPSQAPDWTKIQTRDAVEESWFKSLANDTWIKSGSFVVFDVVEDQLYRWSTCIADFQDTQLTLFKGNKSNTDDTSCGDFLAYGDDSKVSYTYNNETYCPVGTKQTVLEWQANFTGQVTLLMNEYNCSQCYPKENSDNTLDWLNCFVEVTGEFKTDGSGNFVKENGWPVKAGAGDTSQEATFVYPFPLDWQRYDCNTCSGGLKTQIADNSASFNNSVDLSAGQYVEFSLKRGSKYLFETSDPNAIITIRKGTGCEGRLLAQATGRLAYFANVDSDGFNMGTYSYQSDVVSVLVSKAECKTGGNTLRYSYYPISGADIKNRYSETAFAGKTLVTDNTTTVQFVDTGLWAKTWKEAIQTCQETTVGEGSSEDVLPCPKPKCPSGKYNDADERNTEYFCKYRSEGANADGSCKAPTCSIHYAEYQKTDANKDDEDKQDIFGKCYFSDNDCNKTTPNTKNPDTHAYSVLSGCPSGYEECGKVCYKCDAGYVFNCDLLNAFNRKCEKQNCVTDQKCVDKNTMCSYLGTVSECPDGYTENSAGKCFGSEGSFNVYDDITDVEPEYESAAEACPAGTFYTNGVCEYEGCGRYVYSDNYSSQWGGMNYDSDVYPTFDGSDTYQAEYPFCNAVQNKYSGKVPCCCSGYIKKFNDASNTTIVYPFYYASAYNPNGTVANVQEWKCQSITPCETGYSYGAETGKCYKCESGELTFNEEDGEYHCYSCASGYSPVEEGGEYVCKKACPSGGYTAGGVCYTTTVDKVEKCDVEHGWIEDPAREGRCRKLQKDPDGAYVNVACNANVDPKNNEPGRTCDTENMNSYDCDCFEDRCEDQFQAADAKVCEDPYKVPYTCEINHHSATCYHTYSVNTEKTPYTLSNGETIQVAKVCHYTDASGQACGQAMGGWVLPNINQLYSIIDFDLYDPATAYPLKGAYNRIDINTTCAPVPSSNSSCSADTGCADPDEICINNKCVSTDPYGDMQCDANGMYICIDGKECVRNNWYWSSTTVVSENINDGQFTWAVNMEDGRSYRARKGCSGSDCAEDVDLNARPHHVLCVKGSSLAGIFDGNAPSSEQVFSGWACDTNEEQTPLTIYFEILDKNEKDIVDLLGSSEYIMTIPGLLHKGIKYGETDITPTEEPKVTEIYNNCGFPQNPKPHAFEVKWKDGEFTAGKEDIAQLIRKIKDANIECSDSRIEDISDPKTDCAVPPYFVTAYGVNETASSATAVAIAPTSRPFVFKNRCGDGYMTYDGDYTENCESENFDQICAYGNSECELCAREEKTVSGTTYKKCTFYPALPPRCMDGTINSYYCEDGVIAEGHRGAGLPCEYYNFASSNNISASEECDCPGEEKDLYLYTNGSFSCAANTKLAAKVCPDYFTAASAEAGEDNFCYICAGCKKEKVLRPRCGDGIVNRENCEGYENCEVVSGVNEECDDGNNSDTDSCTTKCELAKCGDGNIQTSNGEFCDSGDKNGYYATNCEDTASCPGCASITCGKGETDPLGPRCGDGIVQHINMCDDATFVATYGPVYGFADAADCRKHLEGAEETCDNGENNGKAVKFEDFLGTPEGAGCAGTVTGAGSDLYPVNAIHEKYLECVYKYQKYIEEHPGCSSKCKKEDAPYCGNGTPNSEGNESCDDGLPTVNLIDGNYVISLASQGKKYNGKEYGSCRLDCKAKYACDDNIIDTECAAAAGGNFCTGLGYVDNGKLSLYVKNGKEGCDDGVLMNGRYGYCDKDCVEKTYCGNYVSDCIETNSEDECTLKEDCDFGTVGNNPNKTIDKAYSKVEQGSCIAEDEVCLGASSEWGDRICCKYGRFCGDGTVDNGLKVADSVDWKNAANWDVNGANVVYDARNLSLRFTLSASEATAELTVAIPVELNLRYLLEYDVRPSVATFTFKAGVNEYDESDNKIENAGYVNASPYFFTENTDHSGSSWYHGKNAAPIRGEGQGGANKWYPGTKNVRIFFKMTGAAETVFLVKGLFFYSLENVNYSGSIDSSLEQCDPGKGNFKTESSYYMTHCNSDCEWINYCGDGVVQRSSVSDCEDGTYNGYTCKNGITYAEEVCDNGSNLPNIYNGCEPGCLELGPHCGDGFVDSMVCPPDSEEWCHTPSNFTTPEACDKGLANSNSSLGNDQYVSSMKNYNDYCREDCTYARCGDGILDNVKDSDGRTVEECDCGAPGSYLESTKSQSTIVNGQIVYICVADDGKELYNTIDAQRAAVCRPNCKISRCGDGIRDKDANGNWKEECDDGNFNDFDSCTSECKLSRVGDGIFAHSRSYLCEELKGLSENQMKIMAKKGVADCGKEGQMTCAEMAAYLTSDSAIKDYFEQNLLHCCYNQKLSGAASDMNCLIEDDDQEGVYLTPKELAIKRCVKYAKKITSNGAAVSMNEAECAALEAEGGEYAAMERCEKCITNNCGRDCADGDTKCQNQRTENCNHLPTQDERKNCIAHNTYCGATGWNVIGSCGDGKLDTAAGEVCDNNTDPDNRKYLDLNKVSVAGGSGWENKDADGQWYDGHYCTGECREGGCNEKSPICAGGETDGCWEKGCTRKTHRTAAADTETSKCGDGFLDVYAGEDCDYGISKHSDRWADSYCNMKCKYNRSSAGGPIAKCGDGKIQGNNEICDSADPSVGEGEGVGAGYCVNDCQLFYGSCGDGKITGENALKYYDSLIPSAEEAASLPENDSRRKWRESMLEAGHQEEGPEDCDIMDTRTQSLIGADVALSKLCNPTTCKRVGSCGDGTRDPRFEGCDLGTDSSGKTNAEVTITKEIEGKTQTCFKGCKSNPKGGLIKATNSEINGWACDPDHPMTHPATLVRIEIYDSTSPAAQKVGEKLLATTIDVTGKDYFDFNADVKKIARECGGGSRHGWTYNPSVTDAAMNWEGKIPPYTVKAYATSLDGSPETEVFIGKKTFVSKMKCGDGLKSLCSSIDVTTVTKTPTAWSAGKVCKDAEVDGVCDDYGLVNGEACEDNDERTCASITVVTITKTTGPWANNKICCDDDEAACPAGGSTVDGKCDDFGLKNKGACVDEGCDEGAANGDDKDCSASCQWTKCGDGELQANATGVRPDGTSSEECEGSSNIACNSSDLGLETEGDPFDEILAGDQYKATCYGTSDPKCKWNKKPCHISSKCPPLSTAITAWGDSYKANHVNDYIEYYVTTNNNKYDRQWTGTGAKGWGDRETVVQYYETEDLTPQEEACSYQCSSKFTWDGTNKKCVPKTNVSVECSTCTDPHGVWLGTENDPQPKYCNNAANNYTIHQTITLNSDGTVTCVPGGGVSGNDCSLLAADSAYGTESSTTKCIWKCDNDSVWNGNSCLIKQDSHICTGKPDGTHWISVYLDADGKIVAEDINKDDENAELEIERFIDESTFTYSPTDAELVAKNINGSEKPAKIKSKLSTEGPVRCYYACPSGTYYNADSDACLTSKCGDGYTNNATCENVADLNTCIMEFDKDELCDDSEGANGMYAGTSTRSQCDQYCGSYKTCMMANCPEGHHEYCEEGAVACAFIKAEGYNGRINSTSSLQNGKYYCGDGVIQHMWDSQCYDTTCEPVIESNYHGAIISAFTESEQCDTTDSSSTTDGRKHLCDILLKSQSKNTASTYYNSGTISCSNTCQISATNSPCGYCGDGIYQSGYDTECENTASGIQYADGTFNKKSKTWNYPADGTGETGAQPSFTAPISGIYKITVAGAQGGAGGKGGGDSKNGGKGATGGKVTAHYFMKKGTSLTVYVGKKGGDGNGTSSAGTGGALNGSVGLEGSNGESWPACWSTRYYGGYGGGGGGASYVMVSTQLLVTARGGGGGGGSEGHGPMGEENAGGDASGISGGDGGDGGASCGGSGGKGGNGGRYNTTLDPNYYYDTTTGTNYHYHYDSTHTTSTNGENSGDGSITIELVSYAPCKTDTCMFDETNLLAVGTTKMPCTGLPANAEWNTASEVELTWDSSSWVTSGGNQPVGSYSTTASETECRYKCQSGYDWYNNACVSSRVVDCPFAGRPDDENWVWNTVSQIKQTYSSSGWGPSDEVSYSETPTTTACRFRCKTGFIYQEDDYTYTTNSGTTVTVPGNACRNERIVNCTGLLPHATWWGESNKYTPVEHTITQHWTPAGGWKNTTAGTYSASYIEGECHFHCNKNYTWNGSACVANTQAGTCSKPGSMSWSGNKPGNSDWNDTGYNYTGAGKFKQTWSDTGLGGETCNASQWEAGNCWFPRVVNSVYSKTAAECGYKCSSTYHTQDKGVSCESDTRYNQPCYGLDTYGLWNTVDKITRYWAESNCSDPWNNAEECWTPTLKAAHSVNENVGSTTECRFKCDRTANPPRFKWSDSESKCVGDSKPYTEKCTGLPAHASWWGETEKHGTPADHKITQTWTELPAGSGTWDWRPVLGGKHSASNPNKPNECFFHCNKNYTWNGTACVANQRTIVDCDPTKVEHSSWNDNGKNGKFTQTWNELASADCNASQWAAEKCWFPRTKAAENGSETGDCHFRCNTNYSWTGTASGYNFTDQGDYCQSDTHSGTCSTKPENSHWNDTGFNYNNTQGTFERTWYEGGFNGESCDPSVTDASASNTCWFPRSYTSVYRPSVADPDVCSNKCTHGPALCGYECNSGYHTENKGSTCIIDTRRTLACTTAKPANSVWNDGKTGDASGKFDQVWDVTFGSDCWNNPESCWRLPTQNVATLSASYSTTAGDCHYKCADGYHTENGGNTCIPNERRTNACLTSTKPANSVWNDNNGNDGLYKQVWIGGSDCGTNDPDTHCWSPATGTMNASYNSTTKGDCNYKCSANYHTENSGTSCISNTRRELTCNTLKPANSVWNDGNGNDGKFTQNWICGSDGNITSCWSPQRSTMNATTDANETVGDCYYKCSSRFHTEDQGATCESNTRTNQACTTKPNNSEWNSVDKIKRTWAKTNCTDPWTSPAACWTPTLTGAYNKTSSTDYCYYKCSANYHTENGGTSCISNTRKSKACAAKKDHSSWNDSNNAGKFTQNWTGDSDCGSNSSESCWSPSSHTSSYNETAGECNYTCNHNYTWSSSDSKCNPIQRNPVQKCQYNSSNDAPTHGFWWHNQITQTWNEDASGCDKTDTDEDCWVPNRNATNSDYSNSDPGDKCKFGCGTDTSNHPYGWTGSACQYCGDGEKNGSETCDGTSGVSGYCYKQRSSQCKDSCGDNYTCYDVYAYTCNSSCTNNKVASSDATATELNESKRNSYTSTKCP